MSFSFKSELDLLEAVHEVDEGGSGGFTLVVGEDDDVIVVVALWAVELEIGEVGENPFKHLLGTLHESGDAFWLVLIEVLLHSLDVALEVGGVPNRC